MSMCSEMDCSCGNQLTLCKLCVKKECAHYIKARDICVSDKLKAVNFEVMSETANTICAQTVQSNAGAFNILNSNIMCSQRGTINNLCVNDLTVGNLNHCAKWRAAVTLGADTSYSLGSPIQWDTVLDDPNGNIAMGPFSYTAPVSGYYIITLHMDASNLSGTGLISGVPVGQMNVLINGNPLRSQSSGYLTFNNRQNSSLTSLCLISAGDVITMNYQVLILDPVSGLTSYVGSVDIDANGTFPGESGFAIHYLSSLNCNPVVCQTCPPVQIPCTPITINCECPDEEGSCHSCSPSQTPKGK